MSDMLNELTGRLNKMKTVRSTWDSVWQFLAERIDPKNACFTVSREPGSFNQGFQKFDSTAALALRKWAPAVDGLLTPKTQKWHALTFTDEYLADKYRAYFEHARDTIFKMRYSAASNFSTANLENIKSLGAYGSGPFSTTEDYGRGILYKAWPLKEFYVEANNYGFVDVFFRNFILNTRQAKQQFGPKTPLKIQTENNLDTEWDFLHAVFPNEDYRRSRKDAAGKKYASYYICLTTNEIVSIGGYNVCPFTYPRNDIMPSNKDPYGYAPSMFIMPEVRDLNTILRDTLRVSNRVGNPSTLISEEDFLDAGKIGAFGAHIYGGLDANGNQRVKPLEYGANLPFTREMIMDFRGIIQQGYDLDLLSVIANKPNMTATEVMERAREQAALISPSTNRLESERLAQQIEKELEIGYRAGQIDPMPQELQEAIAANQGHFSIEYQSPIAKAQKASDGVAVLRTLETAAGLQTFDPSIKNDINVHRTLKLIGEINGAPIGMFNTDEEKAAKDMSDKEAAQMNAILQAAPAIGKTAKDMAQAQAVSAAGGGLI